MTQILERAYRACLRSGLVTPGIHRTAKRLHSWLRYSRSQVYLLEDINSLRALIVDLKREQEDLRAEITQLKERLGAPAPTTPSSSIDTPSDTRKPQ